MKLFGFMMLLAVALLFLPVSAAKPTPSSLPPMVNVQVLDPSLQKFAEPWRMEVSRRFPDALVILVHGGDLVQGEWLCSSKVFNHYALVTDVLRHYRELDPQRTIVFLGCNTGAIHLHGFPNVFYSLAPVWCLPDRAIGQDIGDALLKLDSGFDPAVNRWGLDPLVTGNVFELVEAN